MGQVPITEVVLTMTQWAKLAGIAAGTATTLMGILATLAWRFKVKPKMETGYMSKRDCHMERETLLTANAELRHQLEISTESLEEHGHQMAEVIVAMSELGGKFEIFEKMLDKEINHLKDKIDDTH